VCIKLVTWNKSITKDITLHPFTLSVSVTEFPRSSELLIILLWGFVTRDAIIRLEDQPLSDSSKYLLLTFTANHKGIYRHFPPTANSRRTAPNNRIKRLWFPAKQKPFSLLPHSGQLRGHSAYYSMNTGSFCLACNTARTWSWPLANTSCRG